MAFNSVMRPGMTEKSLRHLRLSEENRSELYATCGMANTRVTDQEIVGGLFAPPRSSTFRQDELSLPFPVETDKHSSLVPVGTVTNNPIWMNEEDDGELTGGNDDSYW